MPLNQVPPSCYSPTKEIRSTIADVGLNFRVRNGNGCGPHSKDGGKNLIRTAEDSTFSKTFSKTLAAKPLGQRSR